MERPARHTHPPTRSNWALHCRGAPHTHDRTPPSLFGPAAPHFYMTWVPKFARPTTGARACRTAAAPAARTFPTRGPHNRPRAPAHAVRTRLAVPGLGCPAGPPSSARGGSHPEARFDSARLGVGSAPLLIMCSSAGDRCGARAVRCVPAAAAGGRPLVSRLRNHYTITPLPLVTVAVILPLPLATVRLAPVSFYCRYLNRPKA